jgi:hypothetical protein
VTNDHRHSPRQIRQRQGVGAAVAVDTGDEGVILTESMIAWSPARSAAPISSTAALAHFLEGHADRRAGAVDQQKARLVGAYITTID